MSLMPGRVIGVAISVVVVFTPVVPTSARAEPTNGWRAITTNVPSVTTSLSYRGASIESNSPHDYATATFASSLWKLHAAGANAVSLVTDLYQPSRTSTVIHRGDRTPTDAALRTAISAAQALRMKVLIDVHVDVDPQHGHVWRAKINPPSALHKEWFKSFRPWIIHYAQIAAATHSQVLSLGTEMLGMTHVADVPSWVALIGAARKAAPLVELTYEEQWNYSGAHGKTGDSQGFFKYLTFIGTGAYVPLETVGEDFEATKAATFINQWDREHVQPLISRYHKKIVITELGYSSAVGSLSTPSTYYASGTTDELGQAKAYEAIFSYWSRRSSLSGLFLWNWNSDPNYGGPTNLDFTPNEKFAEGILRRWWGVPRQLDIWWPTPNANLAGKQVIQANMYGWSADTYLASFSLDDGNFQQMSQVPGVTNHFEGSLDLTLLNPGAHTLTVRSSDALGHPIVTRSQVINVLAAEPSTGTIVNWWPQSGAELGGDTIFKASVYGLSADSYRMFWSVDGGAAVPMQAVSDPNGGHMEAEVDLTGFTWNGLGPYFVTFQSQTADGQTMTSSSSIPIFVTPAPPR